MYRRIDTHVHVWRMDDGLDIWYRSKVAALQRDFDQTALQEVMHQSGIGAAIVVQASADVRETLLKLQEQSDSGHVCGYIAALDPLSPHALAMVDELVRWPKFVGVRLMPPDTFGTNWMLDQRAAEFVEQMENRGISVDTVQRQENLEAALRFFSRFKELRLVLNHCGRPNVLAPPDPDWLNSISGFAQQTNAVVKCSGVVERAGVEWTEESISPFIGHVLRSFGPDRVMFGSNWPLINLTASYSGWLHALSRVLADLGCTTDDADAVFWKTAVQHYDIDTASATPPAGSLDRLARSPAGTS
jgi:L-fuconolactonase